jgi:xanthine dehydrogenase accessory factor
MIDWIAKLRAALAAEGRAVVVTVAATRGSAPREAGARLIATARATYGTIGGGHLEFEAIRISREALARAGEGAWLARFPLAARLGQCCGGVATVLFQRFEADADAALEDIARRVAQGEALTLATPVARESMLPMVVTPQSNLPAKILAAAEALSVDDAPPLLIEDAGASWFVERARGHDFRVFVFGNGHVGRALIQVLGALPCAVTWVDEREHDFPRSVPPNVAIIVTDLPDAEVRAAAPGSMFLVMTHSHALDFDIVAAILARGDFLYVGMIGSKAKRAQMERRLRECGLGEASIARVVCPIGIDGIEAKEPGAIAVAVAAELLQKREWTAKALAHDRAHGREGRR